MWCAKFVVSRNVKSEFNECCSSLLSVVIVNKAMGLWEALIYIHVRLRSRTVGKDNYYSLQTRCCTKETNKTLYRSTWCHWCLTSSREMSEPPIPLDRDLLKFQQVFLKKPSRERPLNVQPKSWKKQGQLSGIDANNWLISCLKQIMCTRSWGNAPRHLTYYVWLRKIMKHPTN